MKKDLLKKQKSINPRKLIVIKINKQIIGLNNRISDFLISTFSKSRG